MLSTIKVRTSIKDNITTVKAIIRHPMHTGFGISEETGEVIPAHFIRIVNIHHEEHLVLQCEWSRAVSRNPYLSFMFEGARAGDRLRITWEDNKGETDSAELNIQ